MIFAPAVASAIVRLSAAAAYAFVLASVHAFAIADATERSRPC